jgi:isoaspartyl peptidase/L-asparaginase-like protein (Ntn-hydrolase superfamily)
VGGGSCKLIIHGGAGRLEGKVATKEQYRIGLNEAIGPAYQTLVDKGARAAVLHAIDYLKVIQYLTLEPVRSLQKMAG